MGHSLKAIIGKREDVCRISEDWVKAKLIELPQGFGIVPMTIRLLEDVEELMEPSEIEDRFGLDGLDGAVICLLEQYSFRTKLAYVETEYFGGYGTQGGVLYEDGREKIPPKKGIGTINILLKELGAWRKPNADEFDCLELGKFRHIEE